MRHRGVAYLMVMLAIAIAAVLGMATLASTTMDTESAATQRIATRARCAADSAIQLALYGLQHPGNVPAAWLVTNGRGLSARDLSLPDDGGSVGFEVVATDTRDAYRITASGVATANSDLVRTTSTHTKILRAKPTFAAIFAGPTTVGTRCTFNGPVLAAGAVTFAGTGSISGSVRTTLRETDFVAPTIQTINYYGAGASAATYTLPDGLTTGLPEALPATVTTFPSPSVTNPGHVFFRDGDLTINTTTAQTLNGTLVVKGNLTLAGINGSITVTPLAQMPALITSGYVKPNTRSLSVTLNGVVWTAGGWAWGSGLTNTSVKINGCLLLPSGAGLGNPNSASFLSVYTPSKADVADISVTSQPVIGVRVTDYKTD